MKTYFVFIFVTLTSTFGDEIDQSLVSANNLLAASVYKEVSKDGENNFLISPFSAEIVLSFVQSGARGETQEELRKALRLPNDQNKIETGFKNLIAKLKSDDLYTFHAANKMYIKEGFFVKDGFKKIAYDVFHADLENIQFVPDNIKAAQTMNKWVEEQTENKIHDLITLDKLDSDTAAILINALYFKGNWTNRFDNYITDKQKFHQIDNQQIGVDMMHADDLQETYNYGESEELGAKFLELPFEGGDVSMVVVLPNEKEGISVLEKQIDKVFLMQNFQAEFVNISLPKFKVESRTDFKKILRNLGVRKPFENDADFGGISDSRLQISEVIQKAYIDVNEDGVEAAAATYVELWELSALEPSTIKEFNADHPFIYYIKLRNIILFVGRVGVPSY